MIVLAALGWGALASLVTAAVTGHLPRRVRLALVRRARHRDRRLWLRQAGVPLTPLQFASGSVVAGLATFVLVGAVTATPVVAVVPAVGVAIVPGSYFARRRLARLRSVHAAWPDGLRDLVASIAAGCSLTQAVSSLATTGPEPLREVFARFALHARMLGTAAALEMVRDELADPTSDRVLEVLVLAHERGGAVVREILEDLVADTTADLRLLNDLETEGLEMRLNTRAVLVLPWLVLVALTLRSGPFREFYGSATGFAVVAVGGVLSAGGAWWVSRLGRSEREPRVLGGTR